MIAISTHASHAADWDVKLQGSKDVVVWPAPYALQSQPEQRREQGAPEPDKKRAAAQAVNTPRPFGGALCEQNYWCDAHPDVPLAVARSCGSLRGYIPIGSTPSYSFRGLSPRGKYFITCDGPAGPYREWWRTHSGKIHTTRDGAVVQSFYTCHETATILIFSQSEKYFAYLRPSSDQQFEHFIYLDGWDGSEHLLVISSRRSSEKMGCQKPQTTPLMDQKPQSMRRRFFAVIMHTYR